MSDFPQHSRDKSGRGGFNELNTFIKVDIKLFVTFVVRLNRGWSRRFYGNAELSSHYPDCKRLWVRWECNVMHRFRNRSNVDNVICTLMRYTLMILQMLPGRDWGESRKPKICMSFKQKRGIAEYAICLQ